MQRSNAVNNTVPDGRATTASRVAHRQRWLRHDATRRDYRRVRPRRRRRMIDTKRSTRGAADPAGRLTAYLYPLSRHAHAHRNAHNDSGNYYYNFRRLMTNNVISTRSYLTLLYLT